MVEGILTHVGIIEAFPCLSDLLDIFKGGRNIILSTHSYICYWFLVFGYYFYSVIIYDIFLVQNIKIFIRIFFIIKTLIFFCFSIEYQWNFKMFLHP